MQARTQLLFQPSVTYRQPKTTSAMRYQALVDNLLRAMVAQDNLSVNKLSQNINLKKLLCGLAVNKFSLSFGEIFEVFYAAIQHNYDAVVELILENENFIAILLNNTQIDLGLLQQLFWELLNKAAERKSIGCKNIKINNFIERLGTESKLAKWWVGQVFIMSKETVHACRFTEALSCFTQAANNNMPLLFKHLLQRNDVLTLVITPTIFKQNYSYIQKNSKLTANGLHTILNYCLVNGWHALVNRMLCDNYIQSSLIGIHTKRKFSAHQLIELFDTALKYQHFTLAKSLFLNTHIKAYLSNRLVVDNRFYPLQAPSVNLYYSLMQSNACHDEAFVNELRSLVTQALSANQPGEKINTVPISLFQPVVASFPAGGNVYIPSLK